jgi:hypothetical protein
MNATNSSSFLNNSIIFSKTTTTTVDAMSVKNVSTILITFITNGIIIFIFSLCLFPFIYCYKRIHQKFLNNMNFVPQVRRAEMIRRTATFCASHGNITSISQSISYPINEISEPSSRNEVVNISGKSPPVYENIDEFIKTDALPTYEIFIKEKENIERPVGNN